MFYMRRSIWAHLLANEFCAPQFVAAVYTLIAVGSAIMFTRSGSVADFIWSAHGSVSASNVGLRSPYIATPELLRVPKRTAVLYYLVWAVCLTIKILFGYFLLILPLVRPVSLIWEADFSCWTPWNGDTVNPSCSSVSGIPMLIVPASAGIGRAREISWGRRCV